MIVFELQLAAMQPRNRRGKAQTQSQSRLRTALIQAHEAFDNAVPIGFRDTGPAILHGQHDAIPVIGRLDENLGGLAIELTVGAGVFDGVIHEIGQRLTDKFAIATHRRRRGGSRP